MTNECQIVHGFFKKPIKIPKNWNFVKYSDVLIREEKPVVFDDNTKYELITIKRNKNGLVLREILEGSKIEVKKLFDVNVGDFLIARMQIIHGACGIVPKNLANAKISGSYIRYTSNSLLNLEYLDLFSHTPYFYQQTFISSVGSNLEKMNIDEKFWLELSFPLPSKNEQEKIVEIINNISNLIQNTEKIILKNEQLKKSLMNKLFSRGINNTKFAKSKLGSFPLGWKISTLGVYCDIASGNTPSRSKPEFFTGKIPWVKTGEVRYNLILDTIEHITQEAVKESHTRIIPKNSLLFAMYGEGVTRCRCAILGIDAAINQACAAIIPNQDVDVWFLYYWLSHMYPKLRAMSDGSGTNQANFSKGRVSHIMLVVPPLHEQKQITSILLSLDTKIKSLIEFNVELSLLKKGLMQTLLFGEIQVKV